MISLVFSALVSLASAQSGGCLDVVYTGGTCACAGIPSDNKYFLTSFDDGSTCACGDCHRYGAWFLADKSRWGCGRKIKICKQGTSTCAVASVVDFGPNCRIDTMAGGPVIDASPNVCQHLFGTTSCGWSDRFRITAVEVSADTPNGPASGSSSVPVGGNNPVASSPWGACNGVSGVCQDDSTPCASAYMSRLCPGPANIRCCPSGGSSNNNNNPLPSQPVSVGGGGGVFPIASGSLNSISVNWGGSRSSGSRCHAGIDLYTRSGGRVVAIAAGTVTGVLRNWYSCSGGTIDAIMVYHTSGPVAGKTINYGEVTPGSYSVGVGSSVAAGQALGSATRCGMLHMEQYSGRQTQNQRWYPTGGWRGSAFSGCATNYLGSKPRALDDPRPLVRSLMPAGASFHAGTSFLNDDGDAAFAEAEDATPDVPDDDNETGGIIAGVVVAVVLVALVVAVVVFIVLRRRRAASTAAVVVANPFFGAATGTTSAAAGESAIYAPAAADGAFDTLSFANDSSRTQDASAATTAGSFVCAQCGKAYHYAEDLSAHVQTRHA